jgi:hypothetical protein
MGSGREVSVEIHELLAFVQLEWLALNPCQVHVVLFKDVQSLNKHSWLIVDLEFYGC